MSACSRDLNVEAPDLEVNAAAIEVKAGEAVIFNLEGDADYITFWSGEVYSDYHFRDRRTMTPGVISTLSFSCEITDGIQKGQVSVLASDSFSGNCYDYDNLIHTDWTDITGRFTLPDGKGKTGLLHRQPRHAMGLGYREPSPRRWLPRRGLATLSLPDIQ